MKSSVLKGIGVLAIVAGAVGFGVGTSEASTTIPCSPRDYEVPVGDIYCSPCVAGTAVCCTCLSDCVESVEADCSRTRTGDWRGKRVFCQMPASNQ